MEFGKLDPSLLEDRHLSLPDDDPKTWIGLKSRAPSTGQTEIRVGCPVWGVKEWVGKVYPQNTRPNDYLYHYSRQFSAIELNTTHYRLPDKETIKRWRELTPDGFKFSVKFLQEISHRPPISSHKSLMLQFIENVMGLEDRLGLSFLQLPPQFSPSDLPDLQEFLGQLPRDFQLAVEFRHSGFFQNHRLHFRVFELFQKSNTHVVITDVAGRRDVLHVSIPTNRVMIRFIGNNMHPTDKERIQEWVFRLRTWIKLGIKEINFFIHQSDNNKLAPDLISFFVDSMNRECSLHLPNWTPMSRDSQLDFFELETT